MSQMNSSCLRIWGTAPRGRLLVATPLVVALLLSLGMALAQLETVELPGCGSVSDCTQAAESRWGKVPGIEWPLSFVGFAFFQAVAAALLIGGGHLPRTMRRLLIVGAIVSVLLIGVMARNGYLCGYCLIIHLANLAFVGTYFWTHRRQGGTSISPPLWASVFWFSVTLTLTTMLLYVLDRHSNYATELATRDQLHDALAGASDQEATSSDAKLFAPGRHMLGPLDAKVHVTVVSDYQCPSCRRIDAQLRSMVAGRDDVSISARHFPFCTDCNKNVENTRHPNACRAAVAAESAGISGGPESFWKMHDWLFEHGGQFTDEELMKFVRNQGIDEAIFRQALASPGTMAGVRADTDAADAAGLTFTPMVFINGVPVELDK